MLKKSSVVLLCIIVMMFGSSIEVKANQDVVGAEVTIEPENKFTSYRTPLGDEVVFDEDAYVEAVAEEDEISVEEEKSLGIKEDEYKYEDKGIREIENNSVEEESVKEEKYLDVVPQTGDSSNLVFWGVILVVALVATIALGIYLIKKK